MHRFTIQSILDLINYMDATDYRQMDIGSDVIPSPGKAAVISDAERLLVLVGRDAMLSGRRGLAVNMNTADEVAEYIDNARTHLRTILSDGACDTWHAVSRVFYYTVARLRKIIADLIDWKPGRVATWKPTDAPTSQASHHIPVVVLSTDQEHTLGIEVMILDHAQCSGENHDMGRRLHVSATWLLD
tara:strand:+ start:309 stop:869 length:561 start_codon:yes stop_codon:yes gene_type:complete